MKGVKSKKNKNKNVKTKKVKRRRIKVVPVFILLLIIFIINYYIFTKKISNIYISGNTYYTDEEIINLAKIGNYPYIWDNNKLVLEHRLEKDTFILSVNVTIKKLSQVYIEVKENIPLFYNESNSKTILYDGSEVEGYYNVPVLINYVPDTIYDEFKEKSAKINNDVISRISEIKYDPNDVDDERFLYLMNDGNYVYITLNKIESINNYVNIIKNFSSKKGILYLDSGEYFKVLDN